MVFINPARSKTAYDDTIAFSLNDTIYNSISICAFRSVQLLNTYRRIIHFIRVVSFCLRVCDVQNVIHLSNAE